MDPELKRGIARCGRARSSCKIGVLSQLADGLTEYRVILRNRDGDDL